MKGLNAFAGLAIAAMLIALINRPAVAQRMAPARDAAPHPIAIASISVCDPKGAGGGGSCPSGCFDTHQIVLGPDGKSINDYGGVGGISDEHSSIFSPGALGDNPDYLFFVATRTSLNSDTGVVVLSGGAGPNASGQWIMNFPGADNYGYYPAGFGQIFLSAVGRGCPNVPDGNPAHQNQTFDLNYAASGSVVKDPTSSAGSLFMIYEGTNTCFGTTGGERTNNFYSTVGVATSNDYGHTWPTYRGSSSFTFVPLPFQNTAQGPEAQTGALGKSVCIGNDCSTSPRDSYGRYPVLSPSVSIATAMATGQPLPSAMGDAELSAFVDDAGPGPAQYLYTVYNYNAGAGALADPRAPNADLMVARAQLNGGSAPLSFTKWNGRAFVAPGLGGLDSPVFPGGPFESCEAQGQRRFGGSISYVEDTKQYLLTFVCDSPSDPAVGQTAGAQRGAAWFYSANYDLSDPRQWSQPREIIGSWNEFETSGGCPNYKGWYPTFMSLRSDPGHLLTSGYVFYLWGCQTNGTPPPGRQFSARAFKIKTADTLGVELAKQKGNGKLIVYTTSTDPEATLNIKAIPAGAGQPAIDLGAMSKTDPNGDEFFIVKKRLGTIASVEITSTSGGSVTATVK